MWLFLKTMFITTFRPLYALHQLPPVNFPSECSPLPSPSIEHTLFGYVTGSNRRLYPLYHVSVITDNWHPLSMARGTRTVYPGKRNKELSSTFQPHEEGRSGQRPKRCDKHGDKDEDNSPKNVNNVHNTSSHKYRQMFLKSFFARGSIVYRYFLSRCICSIDGILKETNNPNQIEPRSNGNVKSPNFPNHRNWRVITVCILVS